MHTLLSYTNTIKWYCNVCLPFKMKLNKYMFSIGIHMNVKKKKINTWCMLAETFVIELRKILIHSPSQMYTSVKKKFNSFSSLLYGVGQNKCPNTCMLLRRNVFRVFCYQNALYWLTNYVFFPGGYFCTLGLCLYIIIVYLRIIHAMNDTAKKNQYYENSL